jgi:hypothetical protein
MTLKQRLLCLFGFHAPLRRMTVINGEWREYVGVGREDHVWYWRCPRCGWTERLTW